MLAEIGIVDAMTAKPPIPEFAEEPRDPGVKCWYTEHNAPYHTASAVAIKQVRVERAA